MNRSRKLFAAIMVAAFCMSSVLTAQPSPTAPAMSATELAGRMDEAEQGSAMIRSKLEIQSGAGEKRVFQLQIKQRRTENSTDIVYQVLWPNERKGEAVILHQGQGGAKGSIVVPQQPLRAIKSMSEPLFDSDLSYQDAVENFFAWKKQTLVGAETVNGVNCRILESQPDSSSASPYAKVRSWIDPQRFVPMRIEKYSASGELVRRIDITRVTRDQKNKPIPANLTVHDPRKNSVSEFNGVRIDQQVNFTDADFTPAGISK